MRYAIIYDSHTGNTANVAQMIRNSLPAEDRLCFYSTIEAAKHPEVYAEADLIFYGFWCDRLSCPEKSQALLPTLPATKIALFATAGFGEGEAYFQKIIENASQYLPQGATLSGSYVCTGKMPITVLEKYTKLLADPIVGPQAEEMIKNYTMVKGHPTQSDLDSAAAFAKAQYQA